MSYNDINIKLDKHFNNIEKIILSRQNPITGLLPASTAKNAHGDYTDAWVRDNVYSILAVWGLALSYKKYNPDHHRTYMLSQSVVKLMRGLLVSMMKQSSKVEKFKFTLEPIDSLHAKYDTNTGEPVVGDDEWGHLQLDATSIYVLMLAQMSASGLKIIFTVDEVNFVQNLVHYISRTYCTPDFGIWERGHKINTGNTEVNCSSVGMAKAALEAIDGFNFFGNTVSQEGIIHVLPSDIARSRSTLYSLLPRESSSKETDAALLSVIGFPAYAIESEEIVSKTKKKILKKLAGKYGCKRFLLDGHQSVLEDEGRLHYESHELKDFENIESEWPLFFTYLLVEAHLREDKDEIKQWRDKLEPLFVEENGVKLLPELYYVPEELIEAEKANPQSQKRVANENLPLVWAQSLYILCELFEDKLIYPNDIDPLNRRQRIGHKRETFPMVCILSENEEVKQKLLNQGISSQTIEELKPMKICHATQLSAVHRLLGKNDKLGLSGRPKWIPRSIATSRVHILNSQKVIFLPYYFNPKGFYFSYDSSLLVEQFRSSLSFLAKHWDKGGQPLLPFLVREDMVQSEQIEEILGLLHELQTGVCNGISIKNGPLEQLLTTVSIERIDNLHGYEVKDFYLEANIFDDIKDENKRVLINDYIEATLNHNWKEIRTKAEILNIYDNRLENALLEMVIRGKRLAVGRAYSSKAVLTKPQECSHILELIDEYCGTNKAEKTLTQEIILHLGHLIRNEPELFENMITLRSWYFVQLLVSMIGNKKSLSVGDSYEELISMAPHEIYESLRQILKSFTLEVKEMINNENIKISSSIDIKDLNSSSKEFEVEEPEDWEEWRKSAGMISRLSSSFYKGVWYLLQQCNGLVIGDKYNLENRIGNELTLDTTAGERNFELKIEALIHSIEYPEYRQLNIELLESLSSFLYENPQVKVDSDLMLDVLIGHAVRISWENRGGSGNYAEFKAIAWNEFYKLSVKQTNEAFIKAFIYLLELKD